ncbi:MAG: hypothetical protein FJ405_13485 [Verrucomicrobia bacterium]|nr:hypothetical protein [Verrucomicrobiota bacterium]
MKILRAHAFVAVLIWTLLNPSHLPAGELISIRSGDQSLLQFRGDANDDWWLQSSPDLTRWTTVTQFGTLHSGKTSSAPWRSAGPMSGPQLFYRGLKSDGLFDFSMFRTIHLRFTQQNWSTLLANSRTSGINTLGVVSLLNGITNVGTGARYKGNTSYSRSGTKKSINLEFDHTNAPGHLMSFETINLNNAFGDSTIMREALYFDAMRRYTPCPRASMAQVFINGSLWGVYTLVQQENGQLINAYFPSNDGDRWRTPNAALGGGGPGGGGGFSGSNSALAYLGSTNIASYRQHYTLQTTNSTSDVAYGRLVNAIRVLNTTPAAELRDKVEDVLAVDNWLWSLAFENLFADDDSYWNKGADYGFYYERESGRIHPVEHDGNEAFVPADATLSPVQGAGSNNRPVLGRFLAIPELRQRYLAHLRTALREQFHPSILTPRVDLLHRLSISAILLDPNKGFTAANHTNAIRELKTWVTNRYHFLTNHAELRPLQPQIVAVTAPATPPGAKETPWITALVTRGGSDPIDSVWLYHRGANHGRFRFLRMLDDGLHGDGDANDGVFGGAVPAYPAGVKVRYYVEARSANAARAARFHPDRAEGDPLAYRVVIATASSSPVILNELMASNSTTLADPQGEYDDWIELRNVTDEDVDMTGRYLSDEPNNPRKWRFPAGVRIPANGYLLVWADEDGGAAQGLHASFKLSAGGEELFLTDTDANDNAILDRIEFGRLGENEAYGRSNEDADQWTSVLPTPGASNR